MRRWSIGRQLTLFAVLAVLLPVEFPISGAQAQQSSLPPNWQQLSPTDFANLLRQKYFDGDNFKQLSNADQESLKSQGEKFFTQVDLSNTALNYQTLEMLHWVARYAFDEPEIERFRTSLLARQDTWTAKPYAEIRAKVAMMLRLNLPESVAISEARKWVQSGGTQDQIPKEDLQFDIVRQVFADIKVITHSFSVTWNGVLSAPQSGDYSFSISPININAGYNDRPVKFQMTVSIAGQVVLDSLPSPVNQFDLAYHPQALTQPAWNSQSKPVTLTAGQPVTILVTASAEALGRLPAASLHAMLYWQGPGIPNSLVPTSALKVADGSAAGLQAAYSWSSRGQQQSLTRTDPAIDFAWTNPSILLAQDTTMATQAANTMWQTLTSPDYLSTLAGPPQQLHPFLREPEDAAAGQSTARRDAFLDLLLQNPSLLDALDTKRAVRFYQAFRMGIPEKALNVFGSWAARHADSPSEISDEFVFEGDTRLSLAAMAIATTQQLPSHQARLQNEYLQLPDGRCSLPVAYTLAYSYLGLKRMGDWTALLDAKLADPTVVGDLRVNWLLARAHTVELGTTTKHYPYRFPFPGAFPVAGRNYLDQALQSAQSAPVKVRVAQEIVGRLAWARQYQAIKDLLQSLAPSLPDDQKAVLTAWQQQVDGYAAAETQALQNRQATANQAYLATLKTKRDKANAQGDSAATSRYDALINAVTNRQ